MAPHKFLCRPLSLLYPIECPDLQDDPVNVPQGSGNDSLVNSEEDGDSEVMSNENVVDDNSMEDHHTTYPIREATIRARQKLKEWLKPDGALISLGSVADHAKGN